MAGSLDLCLAAPRFHPEYAGPSVRFKRYAPGLRDRGISMRVFSAAWGESDPALDVVIDEIPVRRVPLDPERQSASLKEFDRALVRYCLKEGKRPDALQFLSLNPRAVPYLATLRRAGIPTVFTQTMLRDPNVGRLKNLYWLTPFRLMDATVVSSSVMRDNLRELGYKGRIEVIPNGVDIERFQPLEATRVSALRGQLGLPADGEVVVFVGGFITHRKGVDVLLKAWSRVVTKRPGARLVIVGPQLNKLGHQDREREFVRGIFSLMEVSQISDTVTFTGAVENVEQYLQVADLFVFPSRREGMPNVVPEAFACGIPSVVAPFIGLPEEFGRPGREYELVERTPEAFAAAIEAVLDSPERRRELGATARKWVEDQLAVDRSLDLYAALYRELSNRAKVRK